MWRGIWHPNVMPELPLPLQFLAAWIGTWVARHQERSIAYLKEENRILLKKLGGRVRLDDPERRRARQAW
jgi:hypothetical protein